MQRLVLLFSLMIMFVACSKTISKAQYHFKAAPKTGVVAKIGDLEVTEEELSDGIEAEVFEAETKLFDVKFNRLRGIIMQKLMEKDPRKKDLSNDDYLNKYIATGVKVSDKEVQDFVKKQNIPKEHLNPSVMEKIKQYLETEKRKVLIEEWIGKETQKSGVEVYLVKPTRPTFNVEVGNSPSWGDKDAKVTVVEYSDFQCPFCARGAEVLTELKKKYGKKIRVVFKNFPLPFHNQAERAAVAGLCANEQNVDLFWKLHDEMFAHQDQLAPEDLKKLAKKIGASSEKFDKCLDENRFLPDVKADIESGGKIKVKSTPTFFINGQLINGAQPVDVFADLIDSELSRE